MKENNNNIVKPKVTYTDTKVVDLKHIYKQYDGETVLNDINLYIRDKEFVTLLVPTRARFSLKARRSTISLLTKDILIPFSKNMLSSPTLTFMKI